MVLIITPEDVNYKWIIYEFYAYPTKDNFQNVVFSIKWALEGSYYNPFLLKTFTNVFATTTQVSTDNITEFIPFEEITLNETINWISESVDIPSVKNQICTAINTEMNSINVLPPPFSQ